MIRLIRYIANGHGLEALGWLLAGLIIRWVLIALIEAKQAKPTHDTLLGANSQALPPEPSVQEPPLPPPSRGLSALGNPWLAVGLIAAGPVLFLLVQGLNPKETRVGELHVLASGSHPASEVELRVDGTPLAAARRSGPHLTFQVPEGQHEVRIVDTALGGEKELQLDLQPGETLFVPAHPDQCAVEVDMATLTYGQPARSTSTRMNGITVRALPVVYRHSRMKAMPLPDGVLSFNELPDEPPHRGPASVLLPLPCDFTGDDRIAWRELRKRFPGLEDSARRAGYTEEDPTRGEVSAMNDAQLLELHQRQGAALARETPP
ncbi:hypothetical protein ACQKGO_35190 [Corallococcus interemptor]|uniref:hypothetical protein n=1 Tax=Corallococcus interemptor TaxID=2316720 RepID=UPI003D01A526